MQIDVLDHGFVRLVDYMGDDAAIVQAARTSYGSGTKSVSEDRGLIRYLVRNKHTSPLEMVEFKFHLKMPITVARQHIRHRTANVNEVSGRYSVMPNEFYIPATVRGQSTKNKQCSEGEVLSNFSETLGAFCEAAYLEYEGAIAQGVSREQARLILPPNLYTEMYWKIDLHNLLHYIRLRLHSHAQYEIQVYAQAMLDIIRPIVPMAIEAFEDYVMNGCSLSKYELELIKKTLTAEQVKNIADLLTKTEGREFMEKFGW